MYTFRDFRITAEKESLKVFEQLPNNIRRVKLILQVLIDPVANAQLFKMRVSSNEIHHLNRQ